MDPAESYLRWCNECKNVTTPDNNLKLNLTTCQHLICNDCLKKWNNKNQKCSVCNASCKVLALDGSTPKRIREMFRPAQQLQQQLYYWSKFHLIQMKFFELKLRAKRKSLRKKIANEKLKRAAARRMAQIRTTNQQRLAVKST